MTTLHIGHYAFDRDRLVERVEAEIGQLNGQINAWQTQGALNAQKVAGYKRTLETRRAFLSWLKQSPSGHRPSAGDAP